MALDPRTPPVPQTPAGVDGIVCPFCAHVRGVREANSACPKCTMDDTLGTRRSTGERIGPWFVLQRKNPTAPGLRFSVLLTLARRGHVTAKSIVRGPTTGQLWRFASEVKGLSRLFGICWHCKASVSPDGQTCPRCKSAQEIPDDPDVFLESHSALPLMRELPANGDGAANELIAPINLPARPQRDGARRPARDPVGMNDLADLTRALAISSPTGPSPLPRPTRRPSLPPMHTPVTGGEPILSASDLATAFQLDSPKSGFFARTRRVAWTLTKITVLLAIVLGAAGTAISLLKPEWRDVALERAKPQIDKARGWWNEAYLLVVGSPPEKPVNEKATGDEKVPSVMAAKPEPTMDAGAVPPTTPIRLDDGAQDGAINPTAPATKEAAPSVVDATPPPRVDDPTGVNVPTAVEPNEEPKGEPKSQPQDEPGPPEIVKADPPVETPPPTGTRELTLEEAITQANELRASALDAEARKDWRAAVVIYEQIGTLPEAARPSDLKIRLALARERLAK